MYDAFFELKAKPFALNPDPDFFFGSRGHKRALAFLEYGLHQAEGFIVVTGEVGAGKTTLLRRLIRKIPSEQVEFAQIVNTQVDADSLLRLVAAGFGLDVSHAEKSAILNALEAHFRKQHAQGRRCLLIVDEAQNLAPQAVEELRMLSNFQEGSQSLLQSFLVGQPEFRAILQRPEMRQLKQRVIASYHLGPLELPETAAYIEHRLRVAGWKGKPAFEKGAVEKIHAFSQGIPRRVNSLCDRLLLSAYLGESYQITPDAVNEVSAELSEELGAQDVAPIVGAGWAAAAAQSNRTHDVDLADRLGQLEDRLALMEASTNMTQSTLKKVLRIVRNLTAEGGAR